MVFLCNRPRVSGIPRNDGVPSQDCSLEDLSRNIQPGLLDQGEQGRQIVNEWMLYSTCQQESLDGFLGGLLRVEA